MSISPLILDRTDEYAQAVPRSTPVFAGRVASRHGDLEFEVYDRIAQVGPVLWQKCFPAHWKNYFYYHTLEETFAEEFPQRYLVLRAPGRDGGVRAVQPLFSSNRI